MVVREIDFERDAGQLRKCFVEMQEFERRIDRRLPAGEEVADAYLEQMVERCRAYDGVVLTAEVDGVVGGYVAVYKKYRSGEIDDGGLEFAFVANLVVQEAYRGQGIGRKLLDAAESAARAGGARWLRLSVLAENHAARNLYERANFSELSLEMEKDLRTS